MATNRFNRARYLDKLGVYMDSAAPRIRQAMQAVAVLRQRHARNPLLHAALLDVKRFQARRFRGTYADLLQNPRYRQAAIFFLMSFMATQITSGGTISSPGLPTPSPGCSL